MLPIWRCRELQAVSLCQPWWRSAMWNPTRLLFVVPPAAYLLRHLLTHTNIELKKTITKIELCICVRNEWWYNTTTQNNSHTLENCIYTCFILFVLFHFSTLCSLIRFHCLRTQPIAVGTVFRTRPCIVYAPPGATMQLSHRRINILESCGPSRPEMICMWCLIRSRSLLCLAF